MARHRKNSARPGVGGGRMICCFKARVTCHYWGEHEFHSLPDNVEGERWVTRLWVEAQTQLGYTVQQDKDSKHDSNSTSDLKGVEMDLKGSGQSQVLGQKFPV